MARSTIRTPRKREMFLEALAEGFSVTEACKRAVIARNSVYLWRNTDTKFAKDWDNAEEAGTDLLEDEARRRAYEGTKKAVFHKGKRVDGGKVREYSDTLLIFMLKARRPDKFRDHVTVKGDEGQMDALMDAIRRS